MRADVLQGDALTVLRTLPDKSVNCAVSSPPYWNLRDYGTATWDGGDPACDHKHSAAPRAARPKGRLAGSTATVDAGTLQGPVCGKCGATRVDQQLGLESTPAEYVARLVDVLGEVRRVLKDDGTLWLNLAASYSSGGNGAGTPDCKQRTNKGSHLPRKTAPTGYKAKDLVPIPWMVAMALQQDGWYLRSDIIWVKPNPMPSSVTDRPTPAHEYIFLLSKQARYYYDAAAIAEPVAPSQVGRVRTDVVGGISFNERGQHSEGGTYSTGKKGRRTDKQGELGKRTYSGFNDRGDAKEKAALPRDARDYDAAADKYGDGTSASRTSAGGGEAAPGQMRNRRSVWTVPTRGYPGSHFATFPPKLIAPCILAGCPEGGTVLDPFAGAGTTLLVANGLCRHGLGIELSETYCGMIRERLAQGHLDWTGEDGE